MLALSLKLWFNHRMPSSSIESAIQHVGSAVALSRTLGVTQQAISNWRRTCVPLDRCASIEHAADGAVTCDDLRPDVAWQRDATGNVTGYTVPISSKAA